MGTIMRLIPNSLLKQRARKGNKGRINQNAYSFGLGRTMQLSNQIFY